MILNELSRTEPNVWGGTLPHDRWQRKRHLQQLGFGPGRLVSCVPLETARKLGYIASGPPAYTYSTEVQTARSLANSIDGNFPLPFHIQ